MRKLIVAGMVVMGGLYAFIGASQAATRYEGQGRYESQGYAENARAACILPWYRFFGACDEAIGDPPEGRNWHDWQNRGHHYHGHYYH